MVEEIIKTALLGTDRYITPSGLGFSDVMEKIAAKEHDKEARFLKQAAVYFMLQSASLPLEELPAYHLPTIENENYISKSAQAVLQYALTENNELLLDYCFGLFEGQNKIITPWLIPDVLEKYNSGTRRKQLLALCGQVGRELVQLQQNNSVDIPYEPEDVVLASFFQIKRWVLEIRASTPLRIWEVEEGKKQSTFEELLNQEKPEKRVELLELLQTGLSKQDEAELLKLMKTKSRIVKAALTRLLVRIEGTQVQKDFTGLLQELLSYGTQKQFFGLKKSNVFTLAENHQLTMEQKAYGLEEISSEKGISDALYHLYQCITFIPLHIIAKTFNITVQEVTDQLYTNWKNPYLQRAFAENAQAFKNYELIHVILKTGQHFHLAEYLPFYEAQAFFKSAFKSTFLTNISHDNAAVVHNWLFSQPYTDIDAGLGIDILAHLKSNPYYIQGKQYYQLGLYLPPQCSTWLQKEINRVAGENENNYFQQNIQLTFKAIEDKNLLNQQ